MKKAQIGMVGLAVMGENLAMNMESHGFTVAVYQRQSNDHIMTCLGMQSPNQVLAKYAGVMW